MKSYKVTTTGISKDRLDWVKSFVDRTYAERENEYHTCSQSELEAISSECLSLHLKAERLEAFRYAHQKYLKMKNMCLFVRKAGCQIVKMGKMVALPASKLGDEYWKKGQRDRMDYAEAFITDIHRGWIDTKRHTNTIGITLTVDPKHFNDHLTFNHNGKAVSRDPDYDREAEMWLAFKGAQNAFLMALRRLGIQAYLMVKESQGIGSPHGHVICTMKKSFVTRKHVNTRTGEVTWFVESKLRKAIKDAWKLGNVNVNAVPWKKGMSAYLMKDIVKTVDKGGGGDLKFDLTIANLAFARMRFMTYSNNIRDYVRSKKNEIERQADSTRIEEFSSNNSTELLTETERKAALSEMKLAFVGMVPHYFMRKIGIFEREIRNPFGFDPPPNIIRALMSYFDAQHPDREVHTPLSGCFGNNFPVCNEVAE